MRKIKILFVCHGNICRSPIAEFVMKSLVRNINRSDNFFIASAATSTEEIYNGIGNPVYPPARAVLARHGLDCGGKRAVQLVKSDYDKYDYLIGMDSCNIKNMLHILGGDPEGKVHKLLSFSGSDRDVADPWYSGDFDKAYEDIATGCKAFLDYLTDNGIT